MVEGNKRNPVNQLVAGDIGATLKLRNTHTNNTLHEKGKPIELQPIVFPEPVMSIAISNNKRGEEEKLASAIHQLKEEDPTVQVEVSAELGQTLLHCQGDMHLAVIKWKLQNLYHLDVNYTRAKTPYRETIRKSSEARTGIRNNPVAQGSLGKCNAHRTLV